MIWPFRAKRPPSAALYVAPTEAERIAFAVELQEQRREQILRERGAVLLPFSNVARGSFGYEVLRARRDGLLQERYDAGVLSDEDRYIYTLTPKGREALETIEKGG